LNAEHIRNELTVKFGEENWMEFAFELVKVDRDNMQLFIENVERQNPHPSAGMLFSIYVNPFIRIAVKLATSFFSLCLFCHKLSSIIVCKENVVKLYCIAVGVSE
jgi:hypothetical protein